MQRKRVDKQKSAKQFRGDGEKTKRLNTQAAPMRGGIRL